MTMHMKVMMMRGMVRLLGEMVDEDDDRKGEWESTITRMSIAVLTSSGEVVHYDNSCVRLLCELCKLLSVALTVY